MTETCFRLPRSVQVVEDASTLLGAVIIAAGFTVAGIFAPLQFLQPWRPWVFAVVATWTAGDIVWNAVYQSTFVATLSPWGLRASYGRFVVRDLRIRRAAVVSVEVVSNPFLARFGLARLSIHGIGRTPELPPMRAEHAVAIQSALVASADGTVATGSEPA